MLGVSPLQETNDDPGLGQEYERVYVADEQAAQDEVAQLAAGCADLDLRKDEFNFEGNGTFVVRKLCFFGLCTSGVSLCFVKTAAVATVRRIPRTERQTGTMANTEDHRMYCFNKNRLCAMTCGIVKNCKIKPRKTFLGIPHRRETWSGSKRS